MEALKLGDYIIAVPREQPPTTEPGHTVFVRGVVLWDYADGTILVHTREHSYVCRTPRHPVILPDAHLTDDEREFAALARRGLVQAAKSHLERLTRA